MINTTKIYYLHRGDNIPFYIGKTINLKTRLTKHNQVLGFKSFIEVIDEVLTSEYKFWEKHYISLYKSWGFKLENKNKGGGGCVFHTEETKIKMCGKKHTKEACQKMSLSKKGRPLSKEHIIKLKEGHKNRFKDKPKSDKGKPKHTQEGKQSIREKLWQPILQFDKQGNFIKEWPSTNHAAEFYNVTGTAITMNLKNRNKATCGFIWKYK